MRDLTEAGVRDAQQKLFENVRGRTYHKSQDDSASVIELRKFSVDVAQRLTRDLDPSYSRDDKEVGSKQAMVAAVMLAAALDSVHKSIVMVCLKTSWVSELD